MLLSLLNNLKSFVVSRSSLVVVSAIVVGILFAGPLFFIKKAVEKEGLTFLASQYTIEANELEMDLPRAREVYDGHFPPADLFGNGSQLSPLNPLPVLFLALPMWLAGGDINTAYLLNQFLFGATMFAVFYFLGLMITGKFWWAWFMGFLGALTPLARYLPRAVSGPQYFLDLVVKNFVPLVNSPLETLFLHKVIDPLISFIFYIPAIGFLFWFWRTPTKKTAACAAISIGLLFYVYWHYWVYLLATVIILSVYTLWRRKIEPDRWQALKYFFAILALIALPYFINYFLFNRTDIAATVIERYGVIEPGRWLQTHRVLGDYLFYIISSLAVYVVFWLKRPIGSFARSDSPTESDLGLHDSNRRSLAVLFWAFNLAALGVWNMQLVTGFNLTANHWWLAYAPVGLVTLFSLVYSVTEIKINNEKIIRIALAILIALLVIKKIVNIFMFITPAPELISKYSFNPAIVLAWGEINKIAGEPKVVSPVFMDSVYLTIYTSARPYLPFYTNTLVSDLELENRFLRTQKLFGISKENLEKQLRWGEVPPGCDNVAQYFQKFNLVCDNHTRYSFENGRFLYGFEYLPENYSTVGKINPRWNIPEEKIKELLERYDNLKISWKDIDADYVYLSPMGKNLVGKSLRDEKDLELLYENDGAEIYLIRH